MGRKTAAGGRPSGAVLGPEDLNGRVAEAERVPRCRLDPPYVHFPGCPSYDHDPWPGDSGHIYEMATYQDVTTARSQRPLYGSEP